MENFLIVVLSVFEPVLVRSVLLMLFTLSVTMRVMEKIQEDTKADTNLTCSCGCVYH